MASKTSIEWTATYHEDGTVTPGYNWNFLRGCSRVSEGCRNCYAEGVAARFSGEGMPYEGLAKFVEHKPRWTGEISFHEDILLLPLRWTKPRKVFVNSMSDLFHEKVTDEMLDKAFAVMALTPQHTYQILTKRPERMKAYFERNFKFVADTIGHFYELQYLGRMQFKRPSISRHNPEWPLNNVWLGVSVEDQKTADERIPLLLETPAAVRWISAEPLLEAIDLSHYIAYDGTNGDGEFLEKNGWGYDSWSGGFAGSNTHRDSCYAPEPGIHWVVVGGESGPNARPMHPDWARTIRDQCTAAGVAFFFKQWGEWAEFEPYAGGDLGGDIRRDIVRIVRPYREPDGHFRQGDEWMRRYGKKKAGRELDGREWNEYPNSLQMPTATASQGNAAKSAHSVTNGGDR